MGLAGATGAAIAAPPVWAFLEALPRSFVGEHAGTVAHGLAAGNPALLLFPSLYGGVLAGPLLGQSPGGVWSRAGGYVGIVTLVLACAAFPRRGGVDGGLRWLLAGWVALTFARACMMPGITDLFAAVPLLRQVMVHVWAVPTWCFAGSILAAFAMEDWRTGAGPLLHGAGLLALAAGVLALVLADPDIVAIRAVVPGYAWFAAGGLGAAALVLAGLAALGGNATRSRPSRARQAAVAMLTIGNAALLFAWPLLAGTHRRQVDRESVRYLQDHVGRRRVVSFGPMVPNFGALYGVAEIGANYLPTPETWVAAVRTRFMSGFNGVNLSYGDVPDDAELRRLLPALESFGVGYALTWPFEPPLHAADPDRPSLVHHGRVMDIWQLAHPADYMQAAGCTIEPASRDEAMLDCSRPSTVLRRELSWPGWHATLRGVPAEIRTTTEGFQTVAVAAGQTKLRFFYAPPGSAAACGLSLFGLVIMAVGLGATPRRKQAVLF